MELLLVLLGGSVVAAAIVDTARVEQLVASLILRHLLRHSRGSSSKHQLTTALLAAHTAVDDSCAAMPRLCARLCPCLPEMPTSHHTLHEALWCASRMQHRDCGQTLVVYSGLPNVWVHRKSCHEPRRSPPL